MMNLLRKLRQNRGESLVEVLVSLMIICVCLVMLATSINSSINNITSASKKMDDYYKANNILSKGDGSGINGSVSFKKSDNSACNFLYEEGSSVEVTYYINDVFSSDKVLAYIKR